MNKMTDKLNSPKESDNDLPPSDSFQILSIL